MKNLNFRFKMQKNRSSRLKDQEVLKMILQDKKHFVGLSRYVYFYAFFSINTFLTIKT